MKSKISRANSSTESNVWASGKGAQTLPIEKFNYKSKDISAAQKIYLPALVIFGLLLLFEMLPRIGVIRETQLPPTSVIFASLIELSQERDFWVAFMQTIIGWTYALGLATLIAVPVGILIGSLWQLESATKSIIEFLRPIPSVGLIPVAIIIFGVGLNGKVFLATWAAFWPILIQTIYGVKDVDNVGIQTAKIFGLNAWQRMIRVTLPSTVAYIATGIRISAMIALTLVVTAELVVGSPGLGRLLSEAQYSGAVGRMYALVFSTGVIGLLMTFTFLRLEAIILHWHPRERDKKK